MGLDERVWGGADEASGAVDDKAADRTMEPETVRAALYVFAVPHFPRTRPGTFLANWVEVGCLWYTIDFIKVNREDYNESLVGW